MYNFRYHLVTILSIFAALALGLLLGVALTGSDLVRNASSDLAKSLTEQFDELRFENRDLTEQLQQEKFFSSQLGSGWLKDRLEGRTIVILTREPDAEASLVDELSALIAQCGGTAVVVHIDEEDGFGLEDEQTLNALKRILPEEKQEDYSLTLARALAKEWSFSFENSEGVEEPDAAATSSLPEAGNGVTETADPADLVTAATIIKESQQVSNMVSEVDIENAFEENYPLTSLLVESGYISIDVSYHSLLGTGVNTGLSEPSIFVAQQLAYQQAQYMMVPYGVNGIIDTAVYSDSSKSSVQADTTALQITQQFELLGQAGELPNQSIASNESPQSDSGKADAETFDKTLSYFALIVQDEEYVEPLLTVARNGSISCVLSSQKEYRDYSVIALLTGATKGNYGLSRPGMQVLPLVPGDIKGNAPFTTTD